MNLLGSVGRRCKIAFVMFNLLVLSSRFLCEAWLDASPIWEEIR